MGTFSTVLCVCAISLATMSGGSDENSDTAKRNAADRKPVEDSNQCVDLSVRLFPFSNGSHNWGYMDREGNEIIPPRFWSARDF